MSKASTDISRLAATFLRDSKHNLEHLEAYLMLLEELEICLNFVNHHKYLPTYESDRTERQESRYSPNQSAAVPQPTKDCSLVYTIK